MKSNHANQDIRAAFTLIEMMVVVAIVGILIAGVFRLLGAAGENNQKAETIARMQRLQNALSGFYAAYGTYPPVPQQGSPDPFVSQDDQGATTQEATLSSDNANRAARSQAMGFEFPNPRELDDFINNYPPFKEDNVVSVNTNPGGFNKDKYAWPENRLFRYGVLSFLLPRVELIGGEDLSEQSFGDTTPDSSFFKNAQWTRYNSDLASQYLRERDACNRWLPNFEGIIYGGKTISGVNTAEPDHGYPRFSGHYSKGAGNKHVLITMTLRDGWDRELYYYSAPPYQSYRVWSAGRDGNTFPPWVPLRTLTDAQKKTVSKWTADDVTRFDR